MKEIIETFRNLETVLSQVSSVKSLFTKESGFNEVFEKACRLSDFLIKEPVVKTEHFDFRETVRFVIEQLEILRSCVEEGIDHLEGYSIEDRLNTIKVALADVNRFLVGK